MSEASEGHLNYGTLGMDANGSAARVAIDWDSKAMVGIDATHWHIHQDEAFTYWVSSSANAANSSGWQLFRTGTNESHLRLTGFATSADQMWLYFYEANTASGLTSSGGPSASAVSINRDRRTNSAVSNIAWLTMSGSVSGTQSATLLDVHYVGGGTGGTGGSKSGGTQGADEEWELKPSTVYGLRWVNNSSVTNTVNLRYFHYDVSLA